MNRMTSVGSNFFVDIHMELTTLCHPHASTWAWTLLVDIINGWPLISRKLAEVQSIKKLTECPVPSLTFHSMLLYIKCGQLQTLYHPSISPPMNSLFWEHQLLHCQTLEQYLMLDEDICEGVSHMRTKADKWVWKQVFFCGRFYGWPIKEHQSSP